MTEHGHSSLSAIVADRVIGAINNHPALRSEVPDLVGWLAFPDTIDRPGLAEAEEQIRFHFDLGARGVFLTQSEVPTAEGGMPKKILLYSVSKPTNS